MRKVGDEIAQDRSKRTWEKRLYYQFPPRLAPVALTLTDTICQSGNIVLTSKFECTDVSKIMFVAYQVQWKYFCFFYLTCLNINEIQYLTLGNWLGQHEIT